MRFLEAGHLVARYRVHREEGIRLRSDLIAIVNGECPGKRVAIRKRVIEPGGAEIFPNRFFWIVKGKGHPATQTAPVRQRPKVHIRQHSLIQTWNFEKRVAVRAILGLGGRGRINQVARQYSLARILVRNGRYVADRQPLPEPFIVAEQERLVLPKGASEGASKLIPFERRHRGRRRGVLDIEKVSGIQRAVAQEFKSCAVELVGAGLRDDIDLRPGSLPVLGRVGVTDQVEFPNRVNAQQLPADAARRVGLNARTAVLDSVQQKQVLQRPPPRHGEGVPFSGRRRVRRFQRGIIDRACIQGDEVIETTAIQRQILYLLLIDQPGD